MEKEVNELLKEKFLDQNKFTQDVEQLVLTTELNYIEALVSYCEDNNIELLWGIGGESKSNSSSWILKKWVDKN